jgi:hypothetical protein
MKNEQKVRQACRIEELDKGITSEVVGYAVKLHNQKAERSGQPAPFTVKAARNELAKFQRQSRIKLVARKAEVMKTDTQILAERKPAKLRRQTARQNIC